MGLEIMHFLFFIFCFFHQLECLSIGSDGLQRSKRINWPPKFEELCIQQTCDDMTFLELIPIEEEIEPGMDTIMLEAQYKVCVQFISKLREGCPGVTEMVSKYPELVDVIIAVSRSPGIKSSLRGEYTVASYAEATLKRECMKKPFKFEEN